MNASVASCIVSICVVESYIQACGTADGGSDERRPTGGLNLRNLRLRPTATTLHP